MLKDTHIDIWRKIAMEDSNKIVLSLTQEEKSILMKAIKFALTSEIASFNSKLEEYIDNEEYSELIENLDNIKTIILEMAIFKEFSNMDKEKFLDGIKELEEKKNSSL